MKIDSKLHELIREICSTQFDCGAWDDTEHAENYTYSEAFEKAQEAKAALLEHIAVNYIFVPQA